MAYRLFLLIVFVIASSFSGVSPLYAQQPLNISYATAPLGDSPGITGTTEDKGFDWWWLLLVLSFPALFLFRKEVDEDESAPLQQILGTKGGVSSPGTEEELRG